MQLVINGLIAGSLAALIAVGLAVVYGVLGAFNLALGQMALIGGYATWWLHQSLGWSLVAAIAGGLAIGSVVSWLVFEVCIAPFYKRHPFLPLVTTIALSMILDGMILLLFQERPRKIISVASESIRIGNAYINTDQIMLILLTLSLLVSFAYLLHNTTVGRRIRAVTQQESAAMSLGIPAPQLHRMVFILSGIAAAAGGIYLGIDTSLSPTLAFSITIAAYAAVIAGGKGNIWGAIACAYIIAFAERLLISIEWSDGVFLPAGYQKTVALLFIIMLLLLKPEGLFISRLRTA
jgi:branched-subunit amino acid ABC-type transport system permease component